MTISVPVARLRSGRQGLCPTSVGIGWMLETSSLRRRECVKASFRSLQLPLPPLSSMTRVYSGVGRRFVGHSGGGIKIIRLEGEDYIFNEGNKN